MLAQKFINFWNDVGSNQLALQFDWRVRASCWRGLEDAIYMAMLARCWLNSHSLIDCATDQRQTLQHLWYVTFWPISVSIISPRLPFKTRQNIYVTQKLTGNDLYAAFSRAYWLMLLLLAAVAAPTPCCCCRCCGPCPMLPLLPLLLLSLSPLLHSLLPLLPSLLPPMLRAQPPLLPPPPPPLIHLPHFCCCCRRHCCS